MNFRAIFLLSSLFIGLAGCANRVTCPACTGTVLTPYECDAASVALPADPSAGIDMLFLSGGGSFGAYGAGVIYGWTDALAGPHSRQPFAVVTGVSTGTLQATHAFLGPEGDQYLYDNYTNANVDLMPRRHWWTLPFASSVNETSGLREVLETSIPDSMIDQVGLQNGQRLLCAGTTNIDTGQFVTWDLTQIASEGLYDLYRDVLVASASVPAASPPVDLFGSLYGDGGVRHQIFATPLIQQLRANRSTAPDRAYFIVNDQLSVRAQCTRKRILPIAEQTIRILLTEGLAADLLEAELTLKNCEAQIGSLAMYYLYIPNNYLLGFDNADFDKDYMCRLFCRGRNDGMQGNWQTCRPAPADPRSCGDLLFPAGDGLSDSSCPPGGPPQCPQNAVYPAMPAACGVGVNECPSSVFSP